MTTIYVPRLIETAEQAEALPDDAIVIGVETGERYTKTFDGEWWGVSEMGTRIGFDLDGGDIITALVPIEAEDEWSEDDDAENLTPLRRSVTPWEAVS